MRKDWTLTHPLERLILLAAASGMTNSEFREALTAIHRSPASELDALFRQVKSKLRHFDQGFTDADQVHDRMSSARRDVLELVRNASAPPREAAERIIYEIGRSTGRDLPPFNPKEGFARWIDRISRLVGETALLNAAVAAFSPSGASGSSWTLSRS